MAETLKISVTTKYCKSVREVVSKFSLPRLGLVGTCRIIYIC
jgi:hypothetical protein